MPEGAPSETHSPSAALSWDVAVVVLDMLDIGLPNGNRYSPGRQGGSHRWAGKVLVEHGMSIEAAKALLNRWQRDGLLLVRQYREEKHHKDVLGIFVDYDKLAEFRANAAESKRRFP